MTTTRRRRRRLTPAVLQRIRDAALAPTPPTATRLQGELLKDFGDQAPSLRTVQQVMAEWQPTQTGEWWSVASGDPEDVALVLPILAALMRELWPPAQPTGRGIVFSAARGRWLARLAAITPDMPADRVYAIASLYERAEERKTDMRYLDMFMILEAWRSPEAEADAIRDHWLPVNWWYVEAGTPEVWS